MAFVPIPETAKVAVVHSRAGEQMVNVLYFRRAGSWGATELQQLADTVRDAWAVNPVNGLSQSVQFLRVEARGMRAQADITTTSIVSPAVFGGDGSPALPGNVAFCVTHVTGLTGRSNRGRTYFGGIGESKISGDTIQQAFADYLVNSLLALRNAVTGIGWEHVVVSLYNNRQPRATGVTIPVTGYRYADRTLDSQRRRLRGRGQ